MIYYCQHCRYTFSKDILTTQCPDCGKNMVRPATEDEVADYERMRKEVTHDKWDDYKDGTVQGGK